MSDNVQGRTGCLVFLLIFLIANGIATIKVFTGNYGIWEKIVCAFVMFFILSAIVGLRDEALRNASNLTGEIIKETTNKKNKQKRV